MTEVTIKIPGDIKDIIDGITEPLYVEALREIARKRLRYLKQNMANPMRNFRSVYQILSKDTMIGLNGHTLLK